MHYQLHACAVQTAHVSQPNNFQKVQRALKNVLAGTFLPPGSGLATPALALLIWILFYVSNMLKMNISKILSRSNLQTSFLLKNTLQDWPQVDEVQAEKTYENEKVNKFCLKRAFSYKINPVGTRGPTWLGMVPLFKSCSWLHYSVKKIVNIVSHNEMLLH